jgi:AbiV family abortive infection protein
MSTKLDQYRGTLTAEQIADGMNCAARNASRLAVDAKLLLDNGRFPSACSLAVLSIEESGKSAVLRRIACAASEDEARKLWREYRSHTAKNVLWLLPQLVGQGARRLQDFASLFSEDSDHPYILDQVKQIGIYTDCLGKAHWSEPSEVIDEKLAQTLVATAALLARDKEITAAEIDLWVKVVGPHLNGTRANAEAALQEWYVQMQYLGLAPAGENEMRTFICDGISRQSGGGD